LLELFIDYQIPSDLLAYDGSPDVPAAEKLAAVSQHVQAIYDTLDDAKKAEVAGALQQHAFAHPAQAMQAQSQAMSSCEGAMSSCEGDWSDVSEARGGGGWGGGKGGGHLLMAKCGRGLGGRGLGAGGAPRMRSSAAPMAMAMAPPPPAGAPPPPPGSGAGPPPPPPPPPAPTPGGPNLKSKAKPAPASTPATPAPTPTDDDFSDVGGSVELDYTRLPAELDAKLLALDTDAALRPTKVTIGGPWHKRSQASLLGTPSNASLGTTEQRREKQRAFDLLDALSRSGSLPIDCCSLHVVIAVTHNFDDALIDTVIVRNVNPIEKLERSALIVAETIQALPAPQLVRPEAYQRVATYSAPALLPLQAGD